MIEIVPVAAENLVEIAALEQKLFSDPWTKEALSDFFLMSHARGYLCRAEGNFAGFLTASLLCGEGELLRIGVEPAYQGRGIGTALLERLKSDAKNAGADTLFLEVRRSNLAASKLYEKCGFFLIGERKNYYRLPQEDALLYQLKFKGKE